jgi:hypothetical protein
MMHEILDDKYTFCIFPDYILNDNNTHIDMYNMICDIIYRIICYAYPIATHRKALPEYIKDTFINTITDRIKYISAYNVWVLVGENFLEDYKQIHPEDTKCIEKIMELYDDLVKSGDL